MHSALGMWFCPICHFLFRMCAHFLWQNATSSEKVVWTSGRDSWESLCSSGKMWGLWRSALWKKSSDREWLEGCELIPWEVGGVLRSKKERKRAKTTEKKKKKNLAVWRGCGGGVVAQLCPTLCDLMDCRLLCPWKFCSRGCQILSLAEVGVERQTLGQLISPLKPGNP